MSALFDRGVTATSEGSITGEILPPATPARFADRAAPTEPLHFFFGDSQVRAVSVDGEPWFVAKDVAGVLGYGNAAQAIIDHCKGGRETRLPSPGGLQATKIIPERDVYRLVMRSKLPAAEQFEEWVVGTVLPAIRKHGGFMVASPEETPEELALRAMRVLQATVDRQQAELVALLGR